MIVSLLMLALVGAGLIAFGARLGRGAFVVAAVPLSATAAWLVAHVGDVTGGQPVDEQLGWVGGLDLSIDLRLDGLALTMSLVVSIVGVAVLLYAACYFSAAARDLGRLAGLLVLFACSMLALVQADHVLVLYAGWELTTVTSFLLIGNRHDESRARAAALHALLVTGAGGLALLGGLVVIAQQAGTWHLSELVSDPPGSGTATTVAIVAILFGALTKSAQYPFHAWLPGAMAAPTPVSAYLHSATMVTAGVFLVARIAPAFADLDVWRPIVLTAGSCTMVFGGLRALRQHDLKLLLAFGTVSQLGLLMVLFGAGTAASSTAGWMLLVAHAAFKAALFMVVGIIDHQSGTRDMRAMPPLRDGWRGVEVTTVLAAASMAGVPMAAGFVAKELAYDALDEARFGGHNLVLAIVVVASMLTVAYTARFYLGAFVRPRRRAGAVDTAPSPSRWFAAPAAVLAVAGVVAGVVPSLGDAVASASLAGYGAAFEAHLTLWHGFGTPVLLSAVSLGGGVVLVLADRTVQRVVARGGVIPSGAEVYLFLLRGLGTLSARVTGTVQNGSLPVYAGVILATAAVAPAAALLAGSNWNGWPDVGPPRELLVAVILVVAAIAAATIRRRFAAAVLLSAVGYAMAALFVLSGAPDLALTQVAVETLSTVAFVLVLRRLPERFERQSSQLRRLGRLVIAGAVGATVFVLALVAAGYRISPPVSDEMVARSVPDGHGRNIVNVILVDFRGFDTLGEITVLATAAIGAVALARVGRRTADRDGRPRRPTVVTAPARRLSFVDVSVRVVFHAVLLMSLWLLFAGHNQPGGGFVGGLLAGSALTLHYIAGGIDEVRARSRFRPWSVLGAGIMLAAVTATVPLLGGGAVLDVGYATFDLPVIGEVSISSALAFDTGVYLAVVGMVLMMFESFGEPDPVEVPA